MLAEILATSPEAPVSRSLVIHGQLDHIEAQVILRQPVCLYYF